MALSKNAVQVLAKKHEIAPGLIEEAAAGEMAGEAGADDILRVPYRMGVTLNRSMAHASRFFRELRDNGIFYGCRCPECGHTLFPPVRPVCLRCIKKGQLVEYQALELGPEVEGVVAALSELVRGTSKDLGKGVQYPCLVKVDGVDNAHWQFVVPEEGNTIAVGARVKSVLKDQAQRTGEVSDYRFELL